MGNRDRFKKYLEDKGLSDKTITTLLSLTQPFQDKTLSEIVPEWFRMLISDTKAIDLRAAGLKYLIAMEHGIVVTHFISPYSIKNRISNRKKTLSIYSQLNSSEIPKVMVANGIPAKHLIPSFRMEKTEVDGVNGMLVKVDRAYSSLPYFIPVFSFTDEITKTLYSSIEGSITLSTLYFIKPFGSYKHVATAVTAFNLLG